MIKFEAAEPKIMSQSVFSSLSSPDATITHSATQPQTTQLDIQVCYSSVWTASLM